MMSESESLEDAQISTPTRAESVAKSLELFDDEQTMNLVRIIARDNQMKCDLYSLIRLVSFMILCEEDGNNLNFLVKQNVTTTRLNAVIQHAKTFVLSAIISLVDSNKVRSVKVASASYAKLAFILNVASVA
jgi:hypothetical protein